MKKNFLYVCIRCNKNSNTEVRNSGEILLENLEHLSQKKGHLVSDLFIKPVSCMNACKRSCSVGFSAKGKVSYLFGDLNPYQHEKEVLECLSLYVSKLDGIVKKNERPESLKNNVLARIPSLEE